MKRFLSALLIIVPIVLLIAIVTKPGYDKSYNTVKEALEATNHKVALFLSHKKDTKGQVFSSITVKDRIFYREIYFAEFGKTRKVAIAAFTKIFLLEPTD